MSAKINLSKHVAHLAWVEDVQRRVNHTDCPAGEDTRQRLYIKAVRPRGAWVGHCFNCNGSGYIRAKNGTTLSIEELLSSRNDGTVTTRIAGPCKMAKEPITLEQKVWLYGKHLFEEDFEKLSLASSSPGGSFLIIPTEGGDMLRGFGDADNKYRNPRCEVSHVFLGTQQEPSVVAITEDFISAYRINREVPEITSIPLFGTNVKDSCLNKLVELKPESVIVWLDPDNAGKQAQKEAVGRLQAVCPDAAFFIFSKPEPKNLTPEELKHELRGIAKYGVHL